MSLELREDPQMMDQRNVVLLKQRIIRLPADGEIADQAPCDRCQEGVGLPLCMSGEMTVSFFWMGRVDLLSKELDDFGQLRRSNPLDMNIGHRYRLSSDTRAVPPFDPVRCPRELMLHLGLARRSKPAQEPRNTVQPGSGNRVPGGDAHDYRTENSWLRLAVPHEVKRSRECKPPHT